MTRTQGELAHLTLDATRIAPAAAGDDALLQDFIEHALMKRFPVLRGK